VDRQHRTAVAHIFAVGDVVGFPAPAVTSMNQGRLAAYHAFGEPAHELQELQPIGVHTVPEISYCGRTEAELTQSAVPYEVGMSRYRELARGATVGDSYGMLKRSPPRIAPCWASTYSERTPPTSCTSGKPSWAAAAPSTTSSTPCSIILRSQRPTRSPRLTPQTRFGHWTCSLAGSSFAGYPSGSYPRVLTCSGTPHRGVPLRSDGPRGIGVLGRVGMTERNGCEPAG
jgi:hypothetical protein